MMRHSLKVSLPGLLLVSQMVAPTTWATPVYLQVESRFPSGHHPRPWLEQRTRRVQSQRWLRVETKDQAYGWIAEEHLLTPLRLVGEAIVSEDTPARIEPALDALGNSYLTKGTRIVILEQRGSWVRCQPIPATSDRVTWLPTESLQASLESPKQKAFVVEHATLFALPGLQSRVRDHLSPGVLVSVLNEKGSWLEVQTKSGKGFVKRGEAITARDLGTNGARVLSDLTSLRSAPLPHADLIRTLAPSSSLRVIASQSLRWGQAKIPQIGQVWWPMGDATSENTGANAPAPPERITTSDLFRRKIFDMASSPAIPNLKMASAEGVFRTTDGDEWSRIPQFENKNFPIAVAGGGSIFVGPFLSDDHGETFQQWIRWDSLVGTLRNRSLAPRNLQILEIRPQDPSGRNVLVKLHVGWDKPISVVTEDQGTSWRRVDKL